MQALDIQVLLIDADNREPEGDAIVVSCRDARERRLAGTDDVPAGAIQVNAVSERRKLNRAVGIVCQQGPAGCGAGAADDPVVRSSFAIVGTNVLFLAGGTGVQTRPANGSIGPRREPKHLVGDVVEVEAFRHGQRSRRIEWHQGRHTIDADATREPCPLHFRARVAGHDVAGHPREHGRRRPWLGAEPGKLKFDREPCGISRDVSDLRVHAAHEGFDQPAGVRRVAAPFRLHVAAIREQAGERVACNVVGASDFGEPALRDPPPHFHLPQPVLRGDEPLREEKVVDRLRIHVGNPPPVAEDFDGPLDPRESDLPVDLGQGRFGARPQVGRISGTQGTGQRRDQDRFSRP